jgi:hypothetical protein
MKISEFIDIVAPRLKMGIARGHDQIDGKTLKLSGYKEVDGGAIEDHKIYSIPVPVVVHINHKWKMKLAWLRGGKGALGTYLRKHMKSGDVKKALSVLE